MQSKIAHPEKSPTGTDFVQLFTATRKGARLARLLSLHQLDQWGFPYGGDISDTTAMVVAELCANAVLHGHVRGRDFLLRLVVAPEHDTPRTLRIEVSDACVEHRPSPDPSRPSSDSESGRGLLLIDALADRWGTADRPPSGKTVWAEITIP